ncbi:Tn3 family transposase [Marivirga atlantica]|jgi:TnpA family transposase|uniref:Tn3 family transposase n=1 Tax=Marivirga atlantica TaxID=1548457 RepID=A0A937ADK1_9BACT|nr:Tn3 family transposase [Marivirga atlantica]MBL0767051.1 Tn3 family transposase [Marivirga atlantica]
MPKIKILKNHEIHQFDTPNSLVLENRLELFSLTDGPKKNVDFTKSESLIGYIILKGYFVANNRFYKPEKFHRDDIRYCCEKFNVNPNKFLSNQNWYKEATLRLHKNDLLKYFNYKSFPSQRLEVLNEAIELVKNAIRPKKVLLSLIRYLYENRIEIPDYGVLSGIITQALNLLEENISNELMDLLGDKEKELLNEFLNMTVNPGEASTHNPYLLTSLKKPNQESNPNKLKETIQEFMIVADMFKHFEPILSNFSISEALVNYYAGWVIIAEQPQFNAITKDETKYLYVLSLISYQYRIRQDLFVDIFLKGIQSFLNRVDRDIKNDFLNQKQTPIKHVKESKERIVKNIEKGENKLNRVREILQSHQYEPNEKISLALGIIESNPDLKEQIIKEFELLENSVSQRIKDEMYFEKIEKGSMRLSRRLKELFISIHFNKDASEKKIYEPVRHYQSKQGNTISIPLLTFLKDDQRKFVVNENGVNSRLYKPLLLIEAANHIKAGSLNLKFSNNYRSINDYMIEEEIWKTDKEYLLKRSNLTSMIDFSRVIQELELKMDKQYHITNENIEQNRYISFNKNNKAVVETPKNKEVDNEFIQNLLSEDEVLPLINVLADISEATEFLDSFSHYKMKGGQLEDNKERLIAGIVALGCNIGVRKMGKITKSIGEENLVNTIRWHFSTQNLSEANSRIVELTDRLSIPKHLKEVVEELHTSSDGQKFGVSVPSIHSSYSYKYFGTGKGISAYTFIDEYSRVFYDTVISSSEREAAYVLDGLLYNEVVESTIHSTDTHGYTEVVFGVANSLGIEFAPRIKSPGSQIMYSFKGKSQKYYLDKGFKILPDKGKYINIELLEGQWDNILRFLVSIKTKKVSASVLLKRLNSYSKNHPLYQALKELGRIHKTIFLLKYFDDSEYRQRIEKQLNKGELWHKFAKDVWFGNNQEFNVGEREAQELALSCRNLIQNSILLWNYLSLTKKLSQLPAEESLKIIENMSATNLISWKHINIHGEYNFESINNKVAVFDIRQLIGYEIT